ncbi:MAG: hypothetical protein PWP15_369 [Methanothermococcus sp.]|jgi:uncharacterized protein (UPF0333 family)|uniref:class III signal peptide-containing protein n=1 Tax=Methanothermococcus TaxID=155862 RepID=UPI000379016D|nr:MULTISPECIES: class III signal peptide-containing protein [Methanothermococcus]MDK2789862.1 hypothetical protein [Methanothermococcus sp.]MDK2987377.1 hypothetical protein [Methanothermococcus sp.]
MSLLIRKLFSSRGQLSLEFSILILALVAAAAILGYYMISSSKEVQKLHINSINKTYNATMENLQTVD